MSPDQKILVIRFSSIGDIILATSAVKTIREAFPDAEITFLTLSQYAPILEYHPDIDNLSFISKNMSLKDLWQFSRQIKSKDYTHIFDLHNSLRSNLIISRSSSNIQQVQKPRWNRFLLYYFHQNNFENDFSTRKMYHKYLGSIYKSGDPLPETSLRVSQYEKIKAEKMIEDQGVKGRFVAIIPGAATAQKQWPKEKYIEIIKQIKIPTVILGGKSDLICSEISNELNSVVNLSGKTSLREAMAVLSISMYVIGSDTGLTHAAEALGKNVSMILGPTSKETGGGVNLPGSRNIEKDLWCRPCSQNGSTPCYRKSQLCMDTVSSSDVLRSIPLG